MTAIAQKTNTILRKIPAWPGYILGFIPAAWWFWQGLNNELGPEPVKAFEHLLGLFALQLLMVSLTITPIMQLTRINLIRFRRMIGLMAFYYVLLHFAVYLFLDLQLRWGEILTDLTKRPYIIVGFVAFLLLIPVALTSNDYAVRKLGAMRWTQIHKLVYPASILAAAHYLWLVKSWPLEPVLYTLGMIFLVAYRPLYKSYKRRKRALA